MKYMRCDLLVIDKDNPATSGSSALKAGADLGAGAQHEKSTADQIEDLSRVMFLHQIALGALIDVTKDHPELEEVIAHAEREGLIEIDVKKAAYKLTDKGTRMHDSFIAEAQDLIKRFDIYGDVDVDDSGVAHFDTGLGRDLRVPACEIEGVDPFRARFLLGLNDGEWDQLSNWAEVFRQESWYREIFAPIEQAPSVEEIGHEKLSRIIAQAKAALREEWQSRVYNLRRASLWIHRGKCLWDLVLVRVGNRGASSNIPIDKLELFLRAGSIWKFATHCLSGK